MTKEEIRQKAVECEEVFLKMCIGRECHECEYYNIARFTSCLMIYGYEHGFADGVEEGKRLATTDLAEYDKKVVRKFTEWLDNNHFHIIEWNAINKCFLDRSSESVLARYEKEQKGEQT